MEITIHKSLIRLGKHFLTHTSKINNDVVMLTFYFHALLQSSTTTSPITTQQGLHGPCAQIFYNINWADIAVAGGIMP